MENLGWTMKLDQTFKVNWGCLSLTMSSGMCTEIYSAVQNAMKEVNAL